MPEQRLSQLQLQHRLLDADLPLRAGAMLAAYAASMIYLTPLQALICVALYIPGDALLMIALPWLIAKPQARGRLMLVLLGGFWSMAGYLVPAIILWQLDSLIARTGALIYVFGGMLSVMLVRSVYLPLTIANSAPLFLGMVALVYTEMTNTSPREALFLGFGLLVISGYFILTLGTYHRVQRENLRGHDAALARAETQKRFLATMSHELRTPLNGILGMAQAMNANGRHEEAAVIARSARAMAAMVGDLLDDAAIEAGALRIDARPCDLAQEMAALRGQWAGRFAERGLSLDIILSPALPPRIETDPLRLAQCLSNLLANALRFTTSGGVTIEIRPHPCGAEAVVTDTGIGLPLGAEKRLFRPYELIGPEHETAKGGTGLGLSISRGIARALGGDLVFERPAQGGARFRLTFPAPASATAPALCETVAVAMQGRRVLVVDDIATNRMVLRLLLTQMGAEVAEAVSGEEAIALLTAFRVLPEVVLMDRRMPGLSGASTLAALRARGHQMPVIAISADAAQADRLDALDQGFDGYLTKPVELDALRASLARVLSRAQDSV